MLKTNRRVSRIGGPILILLMTMAWGGAATAQTLTTLASFDGTNGQSPFNGNLYLDAHGDLIGMTRSGGASGAGTVYELARTPKGYASTPVDLVSFNGTDGEVPYGGLIADTPGDHGDHGDRGDLFGTTNGGGFPLGTGTVFELERKGRGYVSTPITLASLYGIYGENPQAGLIADANGDLFGTTFNGGEGEAGTVFEIARTKTGYDSTPIVLASFDWNNGANPAAGLIADAHGDLFGTTSQGGAGFDGTVFEIARTKSGYASAPTILATFDGMNGDGAWPNGLIADAKGDLFGTTQQGGAGGDGTVFEIAKTESGYDSTPIILASFNGGDGDDPVSGLIADAHRNLFGTTLMGGKYGKGTVFEIARTSSGYASTPTAVVSFDYGSAPASDLIADARGNLYGTTEEGGAFGSGPSSLGYGTIFEVSDSGFVPPFAGTPGTPNCRGESIFTLAKTYRGLRDAAAALGYDGVRDLQDAVDRYCGR